MYNLVKKTIIIFFGFIALSTAVLVTLGIIYGDKISQIVISQLNKNINTTVTVETTSFSFIRSFPYASVYFSEVKVDHCKDFIVLKTDSFRNSPLFKAKEVVVKFSILDLLFKNYSIKGLIIKEGYVNIIINKYNQVNYTIFQKDTSTKNTVKIEIHDILIKETNINYLNINEDIKAQLVLKNGRCKGNIFEKEANLYSIINIKSLVFSNQKFSLNFPENTKIQTNLILGESHISVKKFNAKNNVFDSELNGDITTNNISSFNINYKLYISQIELLNNYLTNSKINDYKFINGKLTCYGKINGTYLNKFFANYNSNLTFENCEFNYKSTPFTKIISKLYISGNNLDFSKTNIDIINLGGKLYQSEFDIKAKYNNITKYKLNVICHIRLILNDLNNFVYSKKYIDFKNGEASLNFNSTFSINDSASYTFEKSFNELSLKIKNCEAKIANENVVFKISESDIDKELNSLNIKSIIGKYNNSNLSFNGILSDIDQIGKKINITGNLYTPFFDLAEFIKLSNSGNDSIDIYANLLINADTLVHNKIGASKIRTQLIYQNSTLILNNYSAILCKGTVSRGKMQLIFGKDKIELKNEITALNVDLNQLFKMFDNFNQEILTDKNIKGIIGGNMASQMVWENDTFRSEVLKGEANFEIKKGELNNFQPLYKLSKFVEVDELNSVIFNNLKNKISINNNEISIPQMDINTSALNLSLSGKHTLDNMYEYHFKVLLSDILYKKFKKSKNSNEFGKIENDTIGRTNLYIVLKGTGNNYKIAYDGKQALSSFSNQIKSEKQTMKNILKEEFGLFRKDSSVTNLPNRKQKNIQIESDEIKPSLSNTKKEPANVKKKPKQQIDWKDE